MPETRKLVTISLPQRMSKMADRVAKEENRTKSELVREALRLYMETRDVRRAAVRERLFSVIAQAQDRASVTPKREVRQLIEDGVKAARATSK